MNTPSFLFSRGCLPAVVLATVLPVGLVAETELAVFDLAPTVMPRVEVAESAPRKIDATAVGLPTLVHETPRSVTVFDEARLREQNFSTLESTFRYVPGVFSFGTNGDSYHFFSRGFDMGPDETKLDGFSGALVNGSFSPSLFGIEQVAYLRGPAGLLYGAAPTPGGMINLVMKKPRPEAFARLDVRASTYAGSGLSFRSHPSYETEFDSSGPLSSDRRLLYRFAAELENAAFFNDHILDRERAFLLALTFKIDRDGRFTFTPIVQYDRHPFTAGRALVISPHTSLSAADGLTGPIHRDDLTPLTLNFSAGYRRLTDRIAGFDLMGALTSTWKTSLSYRFFGVDSDTNQFTPQAATLQQLDRSDPRSWVISRRQSVSQTDRINHNFAAQTSFELEPAPHLKTLTQFGFNGRIYQTTASRSAATQPNQSQISIYNAQPVTPLIDAHPPLVDSYLEDNFYWNAYAQNQTSVFDKWILTLGAGYGEQAYSRAYPAGLPPPANLAHLTATRRGSVTPNVGLLFNTTRRLAWYASYATSYAPADPSLEDAQGETGRFQPTTGGNFEVGAKLDLPAGGAVELSAFETTLDHVLVQSDASALNPHGNRFYTQTSGGRRTRGLEFSTEVRPVHAWRVNLTASYLDSRYRGEGRIPGSRTEKTPPWAFSWYNRYDLLAGPLKGAGATLGVIWQDARNSAARTPDAPDPLVLPAYTRVDAGLFYRWGGRWDAAVNIENLFNTLYFTNGSTGATLEVGAPRTLTFRTGYRW